MKIQQFCRLPEEVEKLEQWVNQLQGNSETFLFKTSGSTGTPKQLSFSREQMEISVQQTQKAFNLQENDILLCPFSLDYVAGKMMATRAFFLGSTLLFTGPTRNPFKDLSVNPSFVALVPLQLEAVLADGKSTRQLNQAKAIIIGGAPLSMKLEKQLRDKVEAPTYQTYGMTETLTHVAIKRLNGEEASEWFSALHGVTLKQTEDECLELKSPVNNGWLRTNDLVQLEGSRFKWLGRKDWVINSAGFKIHPEKVEAAIESLLTEGEALVCGVPDVEFGEIAVVVATEQNTPKRLKERLSEHLHPFEIPKFWTHVDSLPRLANGKVDRRAVGTLALNAVRNGQVDKIG